MNARTTSLTDKVIAITLVIWLLFFGGLSTIRQLLAPGTIGPAVATIQEGARRLVATPAVSISTPAPAPAVAPTVVIKAPAVAAPLVVPRGMPQLATTPPTPLPTEAPTAAPDVQAVYASLYTEPTPIPMEACEAGRETYITSPLIVKNLRGIPIGETRGRSCVSVQDAHDNANALALAMIEKDKAEHPEAWK